MKESCMEGTRVAVLAQLQAWVMAQGGPHIYWLIGLAGIGKSAIARTLGRLLEDAGLLGASFFCSRSGTDLDSVIRIIPTLCRSLADQSPSFNASLFHLLQNDPDVVDHALGEQFDRLFVQPCQSMTSDGLLPKIVIVDAIDECSDHDDIANLLRLIVKHAASLPIKFFITSRPEAYIRQHLPRSTTQNQSILCLHDIQEDIITADIALYLSQKLSLIACDRKDFTPSGEWPPPQSLQSLVERADKSFIYAFTAYKYVGQAGKDPEDRLNILTAEDGGVTHMEKPIDQLYTLILEAAEVERNKHEARDMHRALGAVVSVHRPVSIPELAGLLNMRIQNLMAAFGDIHSLISLPNDDRHSISIYHASLADYLKDVKRSGQEKWFVDPSGADLDLASSCPNLMNTALVFNVCGLKTSHLHNEEQIPSSLHLGLAYACTYWINHSIAAARSPALASQSYSFLQHKFLFWLEVMSVLDQVGLAMEQLSNINEWYLTVRQWLLAPSMDFLTYLELVHRNASRC